MGVIVGDTGCPSCLEHGADRTKNHLILFEDGGAFCNRCGYKTNWKEEDIQFKERKEITDEELRELLEEFNDCGTSDWPARSISESTVRRYGCKSGVNPKDRHKLGSYLIPLHTRRTGNKYDLTGFKVRLADRKKFWCQGRVKDACLFGQHLLPETSFKKLFIAEAPIDCMSVYEAIKDNWKGTKWEKLEPNVVALPHGTGCAVDVLNAQMDVINRAEEVILVFDNDEAGEEAITKVKALLPDVRVVRLPVKDANQMLQDGKPVQLAKMCMFEHAAVKIDGIVDISEIEEEIVSKPTWGMAWPWPSLTKLTYGIRRGEIIGFAGGVGVGKSEFKYQIITHVALTTEGNIGVFDLEAGTGRTGKSIVGKIKNVLLHKPDVEYDEEEIRQATRELKGRIKLYKHKGNKGWEEYIKPAIRHMVVVDNCKTIMLDPLTALVAHLDSAAANDELNKIMADLASMTHELDFTLIYFAHLNPPKTGASHERGGKVLESQLTGSRAMIKWSHYIIGLERNKDPDLPEYERNTTTVVLLKDREFGNVGKFKVFWDNTTGDLREMFQ